ncbi:hypothetical protein DCC62_23445 [candidate division KSB1 bacterium]|nr:MAG: hypothetical protein DCC62_23445 [candidate division KSB1 bacterium]
MPFIETLSLTLGAAIAKQIIKSWLGDGVGSSLSGELMDLLKAKTESTLAQREAARRIEKIGEQVADKLRPVFDAESLKLPASEIAVVAQEMALTLAKTTIDARLVLDYRFDAERLTRQLVNSRPNVVQTFSAAEVALYQRLLREVCKEIVEIASELSSFERQFSETTLQSQDQVLALIEKIYSRPTEEAAFFEEFYCKTIINQLDRMELFGVVRMDAATKRQSLSIAYVAIDVEQPSKGDSQLLLFDGTPDEGVAGADYSKGARIGPQSGPIDHLLASSRKIIVRGQAGSGKSTLLQWLAVRSASRDFPAQLARWNKMVPFFIRLRERVNKDFPSPEEFPGLVAPTIAGQMPHGWVHTQLTNGRAVVLIDGVDELPSTQRGAMLERLQQLVGTYPHARYIVTSRPAALKAELWPEWQEWIKKENFVETSLQPMSPAHIDNFIDQWHEAFTKTISDEEEIKALKQLPGNLKRQLRQRPSLRRLADNPLLCAMICALHRERHENLPAERIDLYEGCVEMLLSRRDEGRKIDVKSDYPELSDAQKLVLAQSFAYWLMKNGYSDVELGEADRHFSGKRAEMNLSDQVTGEGVRRWFVERASLLREPVAQRIDFTHRTFQEFLAAQAAIKENDIGVLVDHSRDDQWRETIILAAGEARPKEREKLLKGLLAKADKLKTERFRKQLYLLAVACLETCVELAPEVRQLVLDKAVPLFPPQDEDDVKLMAAAGDPAITLLAYNPEHSGAEAARCVKTLAMIGSNAAMKAIAEYAADYVDRWQARNEIGKSWRQFDHKKYAQEVLTRNKELIVERLSSWEGFEYLSHVNSLTIRKSQLTDLGPIQYLTNLKFLNLVDWDQLFDLSSLSRAQDLEQLWLQECKGISDLSPLALLKSLSYLFLYGCRNILDLKPLTMIEKLTTLKIAELTTVDLTPISTLQNLTTLKIENVPINDTRVLEGLTKLKRLSLHGTGISRLDFLSGLTELTEVDIKGEQVDDLRILSTLPKLAKMGADDLQFITHLTRLKEIDIGRSKIENLEQLTVFVALERLFIHGTGATDLSPLVGLANLTFLDASITKISNINPLKNLAKLKALNISFTNVTDLSPLANLKSLEKLDISSTPVRDLSPVKGIKGLKIIR